MEFVEKTVISETPPQLTNVAWLQPSTKEIKYFVNGEWVNVGDKSKSSSMVTLKKETFDDWATGVSCMTPEEIEQFTGLTEDQARAIVNGEIPFIKVFVTLDNQWHGFMFDKTSYALGFGDVSTYSGKLSTFGDVSIDFSWNEEDGFLLEPTNNSQN